MGLCGEDGLRLPTVNTNVECEWRRGRGVEVFAVFRRQDGHTRCGRRYSPGCGDEHINAGCAADLISTVRFDRTGDFLASGDRAGRVVLFQRNHSVPTRSHRLHRMLIDADAWRG